MGEHSRMNFDKWQGKRGLSDSEVLTSEHLQRVKSESELVQCACGCGGWRPRYDKRGKARRYLRGHHPPRRPRTEEEISRSENKKMLTILGIPLEAWGLE